MTRVSTNHVRLLFVAVMTAVGLQAMSGQTYAQTTTSVTPAAAATTPTKAVTGAGLAVIGAALKGDLKALQALLGNGRDPDEANAKGRTALHIAAFFGNLRTARLLLAAGAEVNVVDSRQITPLILRDGQVVVVTGG